MRVVGCGDRASEPSCPASLLPQQLFWYAQAGEYERLESHNLFDCIECGACAYVCPSSIPLVQYYRAAKGAIRLANIEKEKSDRSRQRFEFRQARIAKEEAEKEAKRLARQKAAEEAKKKLAEKQAQDAANPSAVPVADPVAAAVAKAQAAQPTKEELKAKLERQLAAAKNALEFAQKPLVPNEAGEVIGEDKLEKQRARIKQAELKVAEVEKKISELNAAPETPSPAPTLDDDPVARAIAKAQAKMNQSPAEKLRDSIEQLHSRIAKAQERVDQARADNAPTLSALEQAVAKLQEKLVTTQQELAALGESEPVKAPAPIEQDAATIAIEKAKAKAAALANMSDEEKQLEQIKSLEQRLAKAQARLEKAEAEQDPNLDAFRSSVTKLEEKLSQLRA